MRTSQLSHAHLYTASSPVQDAHDLTSLAVHMEVEVKLQQVAKDIIADAPESSLHKHTHTYTRGTFHSAVILP